jgi:hypothetical protein
MTVAVKSRVTVSSRRLVGRIARGLHQGSPVQHVYEVLVVQHFGSSMAQGAGKAASSSEGERTRRKAIAPLPACGRVKCAATCNNCLLRRTVTEACNAWAINVIVAYLISQTPLCCGFCCCCPRPAWGYPSTYQSVIQVPRSSPPRAISWDKSGFLRERTGSTQGPIEEFSHFRNRPRRIRAN